MSSNQARIPLRLEGKPRPGRDATEHVGTRCHQVRAESSEGCEPRTAVVLLGFYLSVDHDGRRPPLARPMDSSVCTEIVVTEVPGPVCIRAVGVSIHSA